jgi:hypothetical protein
MCDAMVAGSRKAVPEMSSGSSAGSDEDYATGKELLLRRSAVRIGWLLVLLLRNISTSATPLDLTYSTGRTAISRLVTEDDCLTSEQNLKFVAKVSDFASSNNGTRGPSR